MSWFKEQVLSEKEVKQFIYENIKSIEKNTDKTEFEKIYIPGKYVKLCVIEEGVVTWIPGQILSFTGNQDRCIIKIVLKIMNNIYTMIELDNTRSVGFDFDRKE